jgi:hypothetical protein
MQNAVFYPFTCSVLKVIVKNVPEKWNQYTSSRKKLVQFYVVKVKHEGSILFIIQSKLRYLTTYQAVDFLAQLPSDIDKELLYLLT